MQLQLANSPRVVRASGEAQTLAPRDAALLAWLALEGPTARNRLAQLLWPDSESEAARNALRQRLFQLRRQVGEELIVGGASLMLAEGVVHDLADSDGVLGTHEHDFGPELTAWLVQQRSRRRERVRQSLAELSAMAEKARDYADALSHAGELLALEPLSEDAHRRVMRLHYLAGDRAGALLAFDRCEQLLKHEVGAAPAPETLALLAHIESAERENAERNENALLRPHVLPASLLRPPRDVGRDGERQALRMAWNAAQPFVLLGESGIGKSRLLDGLAAAWPGALLVSARPGDPQVPLALVTRLVEQLCVQRPERMQDETVGELRALMVNASGATQSASRPAPRSLAMPLQDLLMRLLAEQPPLSLLFDDWQFADEASVDVLQEVLWAPPLQGMLRGFASRTLAGPAADARVAQLRRRSDMRAVVLQPLALAGVSEFIATLQVPGADAPVLAQAVLARVGGNPLHILETLRHMLETHTPLHSQTVVAPSHVKQLVAARLAQLPQAARQVLRVAAVAGADFCVEAAEVVCGRGALDLWDDWSLLERAGLFDAQGVAHDLYAEAVQESLPEAIGKVLHGRVAAWLEGRPHEPARLAEHWLQAGDELRALPHVLAAARKAWFAARAPEAFAFFRRAAEIELAAGRLAQAFACWFDNAEAMSEIGHPEQVAQCLLGLEPLAHSEQEQLRVRLVRAVHRFVSGDTENGIGAVIGLLSEAIALGDARVECECRFAIANRATADGRFDEALQHLAAGERLLRQAGEVRRANSLAGSMAMVLGMRGQSHLAIREHERMLPLLMQEGDQATWTVACAAKALQHIRLGDAAQAQAQARLAIEAAARTSLAPPDTMVALRNLIDTLRWCGQYDEAVRTCEDFARRLALQGDYPRAAEPSVWLYLQLGRADLARPLLQALTAQNLVRVRERLRLGLLAQQLACFTGAADGLAWPDDAIAGDDLALAIEWALWSGLRADTPWPAAALMRLTERCRQAQISLLERPLRVLTARRLLEAGDAAGAAPLLPLGQPLEVLQGLHAATPWAALFGAQALALAGQTEAAQALARAGADWLRHVARTAVPDAFRDSFLHRNPVNRELLSLAAQPPGGG